MGFTIFTVTGCARCGMMMELMTDRGIAFEEQNIKEEGKKTFQKFYAAHRKAIFRGPDGVEFPMLTDGTIIRQGVGAIAGYLIAGTKLDGFFSAGTLHQDWVDGFHVSGGDIAHADTFLEVLRFIKDHQMKLQIETYGRHSTILERVRAGELADNLIINVLGPPELYGRIAGRDVDMDDITASIASAAQFPQHQFQTTIVPVVRDDDTVGYLTPGEIGATAALIAEATQSMKNPYLLKPFNPKACPDKRLKAVKPMTANDLLPYRATARKHQVFVEIEKKEGGA